jgi:hypothetical protein
MTNMSSYDRKRSRRFLLIGSVLTVGLGVAAAAEAGLGERPDSIVRDQKIVGARTHGVVRTAQYDLHELTAPTGGVLREYVSHEGTVFAISYHGPTMPDLKAVLGSSHSRYVAAVHANHRNHHVINVVDSGVRLHIRKLARGFDVEATSPTLTPVGVVIPSSR